MKSLGAMIQQLHGMVGTDDLTEWESGFVESVYDQSGEGKDTTYLSGKQVATINDIYQKHFGD
jgi:hypothetical protein